MTASCVLASLNASTYWEVRLGISLVAALLDGHCEQPAVKADLPGQSSWLLDAHDTARVKGMPGSFSIILSSKETDRCDHGLS